MSEDIYELLHKFKGPLHIGADFTTAVYLLPQLIYQFKLMYDEVIFQVSIKNPEEMVRELDSAEIDFAITVETLPERFRFEEKLVEDEMVLIGPENHPLVGKTRILPIELSRYPFVLVGSSTEKPGFADTFFHNIGIAPSSLKIVMITESQDLAIKMIRLEKIPITAAAKAFLQFTRNYSFFVPF